MYVADHFRIPDDRVADILATPRVANLVTVHPDGPRATLAPFHLDQANNALVTHLVRNNPSVTEPIVGPGLVILDVADAYVSPHHYVTNIAMPNVPTWDYITVHVTGPITIDDSPAAALAAAKDLTLHFESEDALEAVGDRRLQIMSKAIVRVSVALDKVEAKAKMDQKRHPDDIRSLIEAMEDQGEDAMVEYLRNVSLPHAEARFALVTELRRQHEATRH